MHCNTSNHELSQDNDFYLISELISSLSSFFLGVKRVKSLDHIFFWVIRLHKSIKLSRKTQFKLDNQI